VVLVSGSGTNLQALLDASADEAFGARVVAVGADRDGIEGLARAERANVPTFVQKVSDHATREKWDEALAAQIAEFKPDLVVSAGFMKILGPRVLGSFPVERRWRTASASPAAPCTWWTREWTPAR
jgi:phosphoribosylglycinamide formyltransferase-1